MYTTPAILDTLRKLQPKGRHLKQTMVGFRLHGRDLPAKRDVSMRTGDAMIEHGYIGRIDQRALYFLTERGKIVLEEQDSIEEGRRG